MPAFRTITGPIIRTADEGADTIVWLGAAPEPLRDRAVLARPAPASRPTTGLAHREMTIRLAGSCGITARPRSPRRGSGRYEAAA